jgi:hypothetical protein
MAIIDMALGVTCTQANALATVDGVLALSVILLHELAFGQDQQAWTGCDQAQICYLFPSIVTHEVHSSTGE